MKQLKKCGDCRYFSRQHQCCTARSEKLDGVGVLVAVTDNSPVCVDINNPDLSSFVANQQINEVSDMIDDDDRDWQGVPVLQIFFQPEGLRIVGTVDGLGDLLTAISKAIGKGISSVEVVSSESDVYPVMVERRDLASEWNNLPPSALGSKLIDDKPINDDDLDGLDFREEF